MLNAGKAVKVSIYLSEGSTRHGVPTYSSILDFLFYRGVSGATVLKGIAGFGADRHMHSPALWKSPTTCRSSWSSSNRARRLTNCSGSWKISPEAE